MPDTEAACHGTSLQWEIVRAGNLLFEQHERDGPLVEHKLFGDPTVTLIRAEKNILVDPGYGPYREAESPVRGSCLQGTPSSASTTSRNSRRTG